NFLDCGMSTGAAGTPFGHVVILDGEFLDDPVVEGGKITFHADTTGSAVVYYRDRTATPKPLVFSTTIDIRSASSPGCTQCGMASPGSPVLFNSHVGGTLKSTPTTAMQGSRVTTDGGSVYERSGGAWVTRGAGTAAPTSGSHTRGSTVTN